MTSVFKIRKNSRIFPNFLKFVKIRFIASLVTARFSNSHNTSNRFTEATVEWERWAVMIEDCDSDTGEGSEAAGDS